MNPAEIDALVASVQAAKASGQPLPQPEEPNPTDYGLEPSFTEFGGPGMMGNTEVPLGMLLDLSEAVYAHSRRRTTLASDHSICSKLRR